MQRLVSKAVSYEYVAGPDTSKGQTALQLNFGGVDNEIANIMVVEAQEMSKRTNHIQCIDVPLSKRTNHIQCIDVPLITDCTSHS